MHGVGSKNPNLTFRQHFRPRDQPLHGLISPALCSILTDRESNDGGGAQTHGLEDIAHVYHGISGARTATPQRVSGDGEPHPAPSDWSCTSILRLIPIAIQPSKIASLLPVGEGHCHGIRPHILS